MKSEVNLDNENTLNEYIDLWNKYIENFQNDPDGYYELGNLYLLANNYDKAIFCFEELLLHNPRDIKIQIKIADILASLCNKNSAKEAIKFYSRSITIFPTARAFFGIQHCLGLIKKYEKKLDEKYEKLYELSCNELKKMYEGTPFKDMDINSIFKIK